MPPQLLPGLLQSRGSSLARAGQIGPACLRVVEALLADPVVDRLPTAGRLLRLAERHDPARLEAACARALRFADPQYATIKRHPPGGYPRRRPGPGAGRRPHPGPGRCLRPRRRGPARPPLRGGGVMDVTPQLAPTLKALRLSGILATLEARHRQAVDGQWAYTAFLARLLEDETERRAQKQLAIRVRRAGVTSTKTLEGFDFAFNPTVNRQQVLAPAAGDYLRRKRHPCAGPRLICGPPGVGKTHPIYYPTGSDISPA